MKKCFVLLFLCSLFMSCAFLGNDKGFATISFTFNDEAFDALTKSSSSRSARAASDEYTIKVKLTADGVDYDQETGFSKGEEATITFDKIPVGARAKVSVKIYSGDTEIASGESEEVTIHAGQNVITIKMDNGKSGDFPIVIYSNQTRELYKFEIDITQDSGLKKPSIDDTDWIVYSRGVNIYDSITKGSGISGKTSYSPDFVLDGKSVYFTGSGKGEILEVAKDENGQYETVNTIQLIESVEQIITVENGWTFDASKVSIRGYDFNGDNIFFYFTYSQSDWDKASYLCNMKKDGSDLSYKQQELDLDIMRCSALSDGSTVLCSFDGTTVYIYPIEVNSEEKTITIGSEDRVNIPTMPDTSGGNITPEIKDLIIINDVLYVTVCNYTGTYDGPEDFIPDESGKRKAVFLSNGGVLKIDLVKNREDFAYWKNGKQILGWYMQSYIRDGESQPEATFQPPLKQAGKYFYGARRFIAKKPDELIIADDGGYVDIEVEDDSPSPKQINTVKNMNRVVTVKLSDESISAVDVNVTFDATLNIISSYGISE